MTNEQHAPAVNDNIATRLLGISLALVLMFVFVTIADSMSWHVAAGGIMTGVSGMVMGASGSSFQGPNTAAILGWAGAVNFFLGIAMFWGLDFRFLLS